MNDSVLIQHGWKIRYQLIPFFLLIAVFSPALWELLTDWYIDPNYSHGFLVPVVSIYLVWRKRTELAACPAVSSKLGLIPILFGIGLFIFGSSAAEYFSVRISFVFVLAGLVQYLFGIEILKKVWFELSFLVFMIPIPYVLYYTATFPMQLLASKVTVSILGVIGLDVVRQGNILHIAGYSLEVAEACSGMRSLVSLLTLGALYAHLTQRNTLPKLILFFSTIPLAIGGNVFRVFITSVLASLVGDEITREPLHTLFGLSVFVIAFTGLFSIGYILNRVFK